MADDVARDLGSARDGGSAMIRGVTGSGDKTGPKALGDAIRAAREAKGTSQMALAARVKENRSTIGRLESGDWKKPPPSRLLGDIELALELPKGSLAAMLAGTVASRVEADDGRAAVWETFPYDRASAMFASASCIRIMQTWVPDLQPLLDSMRVAIQTGAKIEVLVLDPFGPVANLRLSSLRVAHPQYPVFHSWTLLENLARLTSSADEGSEQCEVRMYESMPAMEMYATDSTAFIGLYWTGGFSLQRPHVEVSTAQSPLGRRAWVEFNELWEANEQRRLTSEYLHSGGSR